MAFQKAKREQRNLRLCLYGVSGGGKTLTALRLAKDLTGSGRIAVIDTERSSASIYSDKYDFDTAPLTRYGVKDYVDVIHEAASAGYKVLIIDSLSHAWEAKGGLLEQVDEIKRVKAYRDDMRAWNDIKPIEDRLWSAILDAPMHVIVTMRGKTQYEVSTNEKGKLSVEKLGVGPIQRANKEYEFDIVARMELDNTMVIDKTWCSALKGKCFPEPGPEVAKILNEWLSTGAEMTQPSQTPAGTPERTSAPTKPAQAQAPESLPKDTEKDTDATKRASLYAECVAACKRTGKLEKDVRDELKRRGFSNLKSVPVRDLEQMLATYATPTQEQLPTEAPEPEPAAPAPKPAGVKMNPQALALLDEMGMASCAKAFMTRLAESDDADGMVADLKAKRDMFAKMLEAERVFQNADKLTARVVDAVRERLDKITAADSAGNCLYVLADRWQTVLDYLEERVSVPVAVPSGGDDFEPLGDPTIEIDF